MAVLFEGSSGARSHLWRSYARYMDVLATTVARRGLAAARDTTGQRRLIPLNA